MLGVDLRIFLEVGTLIYIKAFHLTHSLLSLSEVYTVQEIDFVPSSAFQSELLVVSDP
jgi:hypothetical protein